MRIVKLGDLVTVMNEREDNPSQSKYDHFVGLEHYDSGSVSITRWGSTEMLVSAMKVFHRGDILVARRNVYLKRASTVDFDGITSGDSIILRVNDERYKAIVPFVLNTDSFWDYADQHSDGSMSKRLAPKTMLEYEFTLPDDEEVERLSTLLWAMERTKTAYKNLIAKTDELVKSQFVEMFGDPAENPKGFEKHPLMNLATKITDGVHKKPVYTDKGKPFISVTNINKGVIDFTDCKFVSEEAYQAMIKTTFPEKGDVLYTKVGATYGIPAYVDTDQPFGLYVSVCLIKPKHDMIDARFLTESMRMEYVKKQADDRIKGIGVPDLHLQEIKAFEILCPPRKMQERFVSLVEQSDKSKFAAQQALADLTATQKVLMRQYLG